MTRKSTLFSFFPFLFLSGAGQMGQFADSTVSFTARYPASWINKNERREKSVLPPG
jgi:hypothetical protein